MMETNANPQSTTGRILSLDALRGFDMFWIIGGDMLFIRLFKLFNMPAFEQQFHHSEWNGFCFYDLIFPLFLFLVGMSIALSLNRRIEQGDNMKNIYSHVLQRAVLLILFGLLYNDLMKFDFAGMRYTGVLQRIGICYLIASIIVIQVPKNIQYIIVIVGLFAYWLLFAALAAPGFAPGNLTPEGNIASYIDRLLLPGSFCCFTFGDNEGIMSTLPAVITTLTGVFAGNYLRSAAAPQVKAYAMFSAGMASLLLSLLWSFFFPINKLLWTSSYVLHSTGWSLILFSIFYFIIDVKGFHKWSFFFKVIGMNAITIYLASRFIDFNGLTESFFIGLSNLSGIAGPVVWALGFVIIKWLILYLFYKKQIFLKV